MTIFPYPDVESDLRVHHESGAPLHAVIGPSRGFGAAFIVRFAVEPHFALYSGAAVPSIEGLYPFFGEVLYKSALRLLCLPTRWPPSVPECVVKVRFGDRWRRHALV